MLWSICFFTLAVISCSSYNVRPNITPDDRFDLAKKMFKKRDFFEAKTQFKILTLNNPGIHFVDEAQYFLADCHFHLKEYIIAADEFGRLIRLYPRSSWLDDAQFKIGLCYYKLSPKASLDQKYTHQAIDNFQRFLEDFPKSELVSQAEKMLRISRTKLAKKEFKAGELYRKLGDHIGALVYFDSVIENYYDTVYAEPALFWKGECLYKLDRSDEALEAFRELIERYPKSKYKAKAGERIDEINSKVLNAHETDGKTIYTKQSNN